MTKGIVLSEIEEIEYLSDETKVYEVINLTLGQIYKPFRVMVKSDTWLAIQYVESKQNDIIYTSDAGLTPYDNGRWNDKNYTRKYQEPWIDDWF